MLLQQEVNGKVQIVSADELIKFKAELKDLSNVPLVSEEQLNLELKDGYEKAHSLEMASMGTMSAGLFGVSIPDILKKVKKFICSIINENSTLEEIVDAVLQALSSIIPGGILLKPLIKKLVKFIFEKGVGAFCAVG